MQHIHEFLETDRVTRNTYFDRRIFDSYCVIFGFEWCEYRGFSSNKDDLYSLMDHLHLVRDKYGRTYYMSNTYLDRDKIKKTINKYGLGDGSSILGTGFHHPDTIAVLFDIEVMKKLKKDYF